MPLKGLVNPISKFLSENLMRSGVPVVSSSVFSGAAISTLMPPTRTLPSSGIRRLNWKVSICVSSSAMISEIPLIVELQSKPLRLASATSILPSPSPIDMPFKPKSSLRLSICMSIRSMVALTLLPAAPSFSSGASTLKPMSCMLLLPTMSRMDTTFAKSAWRASGESSSGFWVVVSAFRVSSSGSDGIRAVKPSLRISS
ncbi:hypothetical protein D3C86_1256230 [compost metagenome]